MHPALVSGSHVSGHAPPAHSKPRHDVVFPDPVHTPLPSHVRATTVVLSALQTLPQPVPDAAALQWPPPSHLPVVPHVFIEVSSEQVSASA